MSIVEAKYFRSRTDELLCRLSWTTEQGEAASMVARADLVDEILRSLLPSRPVAPASEAAVVSGPGPVADGRPSVGKKTPLSTVGGTEGRGEPKELRGDCGIPARNSVGYGR